jgi:hypothetical protein
VYVQGKPVMLRLMFAPGRLARISSLSYFPGASSKKRNIEKVLQH